MNPAHLYNRTNPDFIEANRRFYDLLWTDAHVVGPERFNTWPLVCSLVSLSGSQLEVAPGLRPRLPLKKTCFVDISETAIAKLRALGANAVSGLVSSLPFPDGMFDLVCALDIVEHIDDDNGALAGLSRVATIGATFLLSVPLHPSQWTAFDDFVGHRRRYEIECLLTKLKEHGYTVEQSAIYGMKPKSSRLLDIGMWFLTHRRKKAMWWYNHVFMPLGLRFQKKLALFPRMIDTDLVSEVLLVCRKDGKAAERY